MTDSVMRRTRFLVLEAMYEAETSGHDPAAVLSRRLADESAESPDLATEKVQRRAARMLAGTLDAAPRADELISRAAPKYPLASLPVVDRNILRLAIWELLAEPLAPAAAVVNEAVEVAHRYGGEKSPAFVNGVLRTVSARIAAERADPSPGGVDPQLSPTQET